MLFGNRWAILAVTAVVMALAGVYTWLQDPVYESGTTLRIDDPNAGMDVLAQLPQAGGMRKGVIETEMVVLASRRMAETVADSLHLHVELEQPRLPREEVLRVTRAPRDAAPNVYRFELGTGGAYAVTSEVPVRGGLPKTVTPGVPFTLGDLALELDRGIRANAPKTLVVRVRPFRAAVDGVRRSLTVQRVNPDADILVIRYQTSDQELAAAVPNALTCRPSVTRWWRSATRWPTCCGAWRAAPATRTPRRRTASWPPSRCSWRTPRSRTCCAPSRSWRTSAGR
jgi:hypothetical protein